MLVVLDPVLITLVESCDVVYADALFVLTASFLDLADKVWNGASEIDKQVRRIYKRHHKVEKI